MSQLCTRQAIYDSVGNNGELHQVLHTALDPILRDLDVALTWQDTSREGQRCWWSCGCETMNNAPSNRPHAAAAQAEYWTPQEWEEYEAGEQEHLTHKGNRPKTERRYEVHTLLRKDARKGQ
eukprot:2132455-Amphidinium_carterae.1